MTFYVAARFLPLSIIFLVLLFFYPRLPAIQWQVAVPTVIISIIVAICLLGLLRVDSQWLYEKYTFQMRFADKNGQGVPNIKVKIKWIGPEAPRPTSSHDEFISKDGSFEVTKERGQKVEIRIEKDGFYNVEVDVGQWVILKIKNYVHKIDITWTKDWKQWTKGTMITTAKNWHPLTDGPISIDMISLSEPLISPFPEYTEKDIQELEAQR